MNQCSNCRSPKVYQKGLCSACYQYQRRTGMQRPVDKPRTDTMQAIADELKRLGEEHIGDGLAPTFGDWDKLRQPSLPTAFVVLNSQNLKRTAHDWQAFVKLHTGMTVEDRSHAIDRANVEFDIEIVLQGELYGFYEKYPPSGLQVCSVREDEHYIYMLVR